MHNRAKRRFKRTVFVGGMLVLSFLVVHRGLAQQAGTGQAVTVDRTKMGVYRALAQLCFQSFQKGDAATAAILARILERTWDVEQGELRKSSPDVWGQIDSSMDGFIKPLIGYAKALPDAAKVEAAYKTFLEKLTAAD